MTPERFRQIRNVFDALVELEPATRAAFLEEACQGDDELRSEVQHLIAAHEQAPGWLDKLVGEGLRESQEPSSGEKGTDAPAPRLEGRRIGPYEILRELCAGGVGTVYLATRADGVFRNFVAIKIVQSEAVPPEALRRFQQESEIHASLDHPNIARILDGGFTEEGLPYLVMEYVEGKRIDVYCDERRLSVNERLRLLETVFSAIRYAHEQHVVHRDLKPSNILVTADGVVKLLGFGIAKLLPITEQEREVDQSFRAAVGRLINSVLAHGRQAPEEPLNLSPPKKSSVDATGDLTMTCPARFQPGAILVQRYRIVHLLGRGGMGEVYRADDLVLGQAVALKFLPPAAMAKASALSRFRNEVRTARQISHPNVCRVYDIGEAEGLTYLSMEYVDGEDLASLLRRIGKLPQDKALEIACQLCAGLAAAHNKGVIHRDLKPANIMLDGKGHVRITDFGLAGVAAHVRDVRSGTPAYMSPEQVAGKGVTLRSDIYALGIVLHELLTGKRPPLEAANQLDPSIARVVERCLEPDPQMRPASALQVSAALPGGDPLAAALARGETPAPELVANAGPVEGLRPLVAVACLGAVMVGLGLLCVLRQRNDLINRIPMDNSSEVLGAKARDIAKAFGYTERPVDTFFGWQYDTDYLRYLWDRRNPSAQGGSVYAPYPPAVYFWYWQSARYLTNILPDQDFSIFRREVLEPDMQAVTLDSEGRLLEFHARPSDLSRNLSASVFDWYKLFAAAGQELTHFRPAEPELTPAGPFDTQAAWTGPGNTGLDGNLRVEAAAFRGRLVFFRVLGPWAQPDQSPPPLKTLLSVPLFILSLIAMPAIGGLMAWRNARSGRGDRRGAFRVAGFAFLFLFVQDLAAFHHTPTSAEFYLFYAGLRDAVVAGLLGWVLYMALEPQVRRSAPQVLISWRRLLAGRLRDQLVGGHLLIGISLGVTCLCAAEAFLTPISQAAGLSSTPPGLAGSAGMLLGYWFWDGIVGVFGGLIYMFVLNLISIPVRAKWLALSIFVLLLTLVLTPYATGPSLAIGRSIVFFGMVAFALARFGVLTAAAAVYAQVLLLQFPLTANWSAWYAPAALLALATLVGLAFYGFVTTLRGRPLPQIRPRGVSADAA